MKPGSFRGRVLLSAITFLIPPVVARPALAQPSASNVAFSEGKALMDQGHVPEACKKFAESLQLERRGGTLLNLAVCREKEGRYATALSLLHEARDRAVADARSDRIALADERMPFVLARVSSLTVRVPSGADTPDLLIQLDGTDLPRARWGTPEPVDPGPHTVTAMVSGRARFTTTLRIGETGAPEIAQIEIPSPPPVLVPVVPEAVAPSESRLPPPPVPETEHARADWRAPVGWVSVVLGVAAVATGAGYGLRAIHDVNESNPSCANDECRNATAYDENLDAHTSARVADVAIPLGLAAAAVGVYFIVTRRSVGASAHGSMGDMRLGLVAAQGSRLVLGGTF
jgi:hypothetical protein